MLEKILFVDDDDIFLSICTARLRHQFQVDVAYSGADGLEAAATRGPYAVILSDMYMPGMDGVEFLSKVRQISPNSTRMMLTGRADTDLAIEAVNEGNIFRFLVKPCEFETLLKAITAGVTQYRLVAAEKEHLETLQGTTRILTDVLAIINPIAFSRATRLQQIVRQLATHLHLEDVWQFELAAVLSQIGCVTLSAESLEAVYSGRKASEEDRRLFAAQPEIAGKLLSRIPRLKMIAQIIEHQNNPVPIDANQELKSCDRVALGSQLLKAAFDFDTLTSSGFSTSRAIAELTKVPARCDPRIVAALHTMEVCHDGTEVRVLRIDQICVEMILDEDVRANNGMLLVKRGQEVTYPLWLRLHAYARNKSMPSRLRVRVPSMYVDPVCNFGAMDTLCTT